MPLLYDARLIDNSGIGTTIQGQLGELVSRKLPLTLVGASSRLRKQLPDFPGNIVDFDGELYSIREQLAFPGRSHTAIHFPHYNASLRFLDRSTVTVHDLIHLQSEQFRNPVYRGYALLMLSAITRRAKCILTVSETTRSQLLHLFPHARHKTFTTPNGVDHRLFRPVQDAAVRRFRSQFALPDQYLLAIGIAKRHKNLDALLRALALLWREGRGLPLVIAGTGGKIPEYAARELQENVARKNVILLPRIEPADMSAMYCSAEALVMPSRFEGFGLPALEALACGTRVICSNIPSLREVCADAAVYFDPHVPEEIAGAIQSGLEAKRSKQQRISRASLFTWHRNVDSMLRAFAASGVNFK